MNDIHHYARVGAAVRLAQLGDEMTTIRRAFPDLRFQNRVAALLAMNGASRLSDTTATPDEGEPVVRRRRRKLTRAEKKAISARMTKYWAARKRNRS